MGYILIMIELGCWHWIRKVTEKYWNLETGESLEAHKITTFKVMW